MASPKTIDEFELLKSISRKSFEITVVELFSKAFKFGLVVDSSAPGSKASVE